MSNVRRRRREADSFSEMQGSTMFSPCKVVQASWILLRPLRISPVPAVTPIRTSPKGWRLSLIRMMGGGPRTFPGGVTKWQWKRMQEKKARQQEKARLQRERQVYEMRRRAELLAATPDLEIPWEKHSRFRPASAVTADEQIKRLASRFEKNGAEDLWNDADGPVTFVRPDGKPSARLLPPNAVHSTQLYRRHTSSKPAPSNAGENLGFDSKALPSMFGRTEEEESRLEKNLSSHARKPLRVLPPLLPPLQDPSQLDFSGRRRPRSANVEQ